MAMVSIVVPLYNEEEIISRFHQEMIHALSALEPTFEVIYVNDGSRDKTSRILHDLIRTPHQRLTFVLADFRKNYGQTAALQAGFDLARGEIIIAMDGDMQHLPSEIGLFLDKIHEGYDLVSGWRANRIDNFWLRRLPSLIANRMMAKRSGVELQDFGTTFKAYRREVVQEINLYGELHRFIPVLAAERGASICEIPITNVMRKTGRSKYGITRTFRVFFDVLTLAFLSRFGTRPMHVMGLTGATFMTTSFALILYIILDYLINHSDLRGTLQIAIMMFLFGSQLLATGLVLEMLVRVGHEATGKKIYTVRQITRSEPSP
ncbi:MAG: glycosyltransferase family 2 protein [Magnetococcales bacterium]|nr:glycosyltransferase family 2 protein [Magnetococcales bacterium]